MSKLWNLFFDWNENLTSIEIVEIKIGTLQIDDYDYDYDDDIDEIDIKFNVFNNFLRSML